MTPRFLLLSVACAQLLSVSTPGQLARPKLRPPTNTAASVLPGEPRARVLVRDGVTNACTLVPFMEWYALPDREKLRTPNPMPKWDCHLGKVVQVTKHGLFVVIITYTGLRSDNPRRYESPPRLLRNYPKADTKKDGDSFRFVAFDTGETYQYSDALGVVRTIGVLDYGLPVESK